jgi:hypothetical protein
LASKIFLTLTSEHSKQMEAAPPPLSSPGGAGQTGIPGLERNTQSFNANPIDRQVRLNELLDGSASGNPETNAVGPESQIVSPTNPQTLSVEIDSPAGQSPRQDQDATAYVPDSPGDGEGEPLPTPSDEGSHHQQQLQQEDDSGPPLVFKNASGQKSNFNVKTATVRFETSLSATVKNLIEKINEVEYSPEASSDHLVTFDENNQTLKFGKSLDRPGEPAFSVRVPTIDERALKANAHVDMEMLANYLNLYIDHAYFFRSRDNPADFDRLHVNLVKSAVIDKIDQVFQDLNALETSAPVSQVSLDVNQNDNVLAKIAEKIESNYGKKCQELLSSAEQGPSSSCREGMRKLFSSIFPAVLHERPQIFLSIVVHYILSRILLIGSPGSSSESQSAIETPNGRDLYNSILEKSRIWNSRTPVAAAPQQPAPDTPSGESTGVLDSPTNSELPTPESPAGSESGEYPVSPTGSDVQDRRS